MVMKREHNIILLILFLLVFIFSAYAYSYDTGVKKYPQGPNITSSDRVLIVAPHPDDESVSSTGIIRYCVENNIPVHVMVVTNGGKGNLAQIRHFETLNATAKLGLKSQNVTFLDYPQVVDRLFNENWDLNHLYTDGTNHNPFAYQKNSTYAGVSVETNMESLIKQYQPTIIIYPASNDANTDHWSTGAFVDYAINKMGYQTKRYNYLIHEDLTLWPFPRSYFPQSYLLPPLILANQTQWIVFPLKPSDEQLKYDVLNSYQSQMQKDPVFLRSYIRKNELFSYHNEINISKINDSMNYNIGSDFPRTVFHDPIGDTSIKPTDILYSTFEHINKFDISDIGFELDNNTTWISLKNTGGISKTGIYQFHIRGFGNDVVKRVDFTVENGKINYYMPSSNGINPPLIVRVSDNGIIVGIPDMSNFNSYMIDVETSNGTDYVDRSGYFTVNSV
jgi:LmbE family N-acetylglucosaminyl deacetylase